MSQYPRKRVVVVVGYNDSLICCSTINLTGYSVSHDGGGTFTDLGTPTDPNIMSEGDPALAVHDGTFYIASLATDSAGNSLIAVYSMPVGSNKFTLLSVPVNVGSANVNFADKPYLASKRSGPHAWVGW